MDERYGPITEEDLPELAKILSWSFNFPPDDAPVWMRRAGLENVRALRRAGKIEATCVLIPHAQFFAGKSVPAMGIAGVATPAESRGTGGAVAIMRAVLRELAERGVATSNLYPASLTLYRRVGYEVAGRRWEIKAPLAVMPRDSGGGLPMREIREDERPRLEAVYREHARHVNGYLDRGPYVWKRVFEPRGERARAFVAGEDEGYVVYYEKHGGTVDYSLFATDLVARTPAAARRLLGFLGNHGTLADSVTWHGAPSGALVHLLPALGCTIRMQHPWMTRIVDLPRALAARGWPPGAGGSLELEVKDDLLPGNDGRFVLTVVGGEASVERGGRGTFQLDVRALSALFSAHATARDLALAGSLHAPEDDLVRADALFACASPCLADFF